MLGFSIFLIFLVTSVRCADHNTFKNCSRVSFCRALRNQTLDSSLQFAANLSEIQQSEDVTTIPLYNLNNETLILQINLLDGLTARIKILEPNHTRYELSGILDREPVEVPFSTVYDKNKTLTLSARRGSVNYTVVITSGPPFTVEFYYEDQLEIVLNGSHLFMENTNDSQAFSFKIEFDGASKLYGLFHHATKLALTETANGSSDPFRLRNSDTANYEVNSPMALYSSVPVIYGHSSNGTSGIFLHNAAEQWVDISYTGDRPSAYFMVESSTLDLFVMFGPTPKEVVRQYTNLTGVAHLPQLWTLGYHQCRFTYWTQEEVKEVVANMDIHNFPMDAIWLDDGHSDANRYFKWNPENFSDPIEMQQNISATGRVMVSISDPHIKVDPNYSVYDDGTEKGYFVKWANGSDFRGVCWPGLSSWIDFLNPDASDYYASLYGYDKFVGSTETLAGIWNDMNEPSVFNNSFEITFPFDLVHHGGVLHRDVHNIYGFLQTRATHQGLMKRDGRRKRPFILTRSHFAGSQRYAAIWTGDNTADWPYLTVSYSECMTANLLGIVFCGADIGGFFDNPSEQLIQRWYQAAIWLPFFRGHSNKGTDRREPYVYNAEVQITIRTSFKLRYKHIPVWYTLFYQHTRYGDPIVRPLFYHYPELLEYDDHLLLGSDILATPVMVQNATQVTVTFPGDETNYWYRVDDESWRLYPGGTKAIISAALDQWSVAPFFYRGGGIIPRKDVERSSTSKMLNDPYTLYINADVNNYAEGYLYIDDYTSFEYVDKSSYLYVQLFYIAQTQGVHFNIIDGDSSGITLTIQRIIVHRIPVNNTEKVIEAEYTTTIDGTPLHTIDFVKELNMRSNSFFLYI